MQESGTPGASPKSEMAKRLEQMLVAQAPSESGRAAVEAAMRDVQKRTRLRILVWGPGEGGGDLFRKRCQIRDTLRKMGHEADFPEDLYPREWLATTGLNLTVSELVQARMCDYIVCLMASPGAIGEVHDFARDADLAVKMMICVDRQHSNGYSAQGVLRIFEGANGKLEWFDSPQDIDSCHLAGRVVEQARKVAESKQYRIAQMGRPS